MTKNKRGLWIGLLILAAAVFIVVRQRQSQASLRAENEVLRRQVAQLESERDRSSNRLTTSSPGPALSSDRLRELLRLRGEVGLLRREQREREQALAARARAVQSAGTSISSAEVSSGGALPLQLQLVVDGPGENSESLTNQTASGPGEILHVQKAPLLDYTAIQSATVTLNPATGTPQIDIEFNDVGRELFAAITRENINKRLAIVLGGRLYSAPVIRSEITGGRGQVTGSFSAEEAQALAAKINEAIQSNGTRLREPQ
jgi:preprotein translocase subunit SecD